jgi:O-antigen/teichoic acid export membrane protein
MNRKEPTPADGGSLPMKPDPQALEIRGRLLARNTIFNFAGLTLPLLVGLLTLPAVIRHLGPDAFGIFSLVLVVFGYFGVFDLGLGRATTKFVAEELGRGERRTAGAYLWTTIVLQAGLGLIGAAALALATPFLVNSVLHVPEAFIGEAKAALYWMAAFLPPVLAMPSFRGLLEAGQRFGLVNAIKIPTNAMTYLAPFIGVLLGARIVGMVILFGASRILALGFWIAACAKVFPGVYRRSFLPWRRIREVLTFGSWNTLSSVIWPLLMSLDRFVIGAVLTVEAVGLFAAPAEVAARLGIIPGSLALTIFPAFSSLNGADRRPEARLLYRRSLKYTILILGFATAVAGAFSKFFLQTWLGPAFAGESVVVFQILVFGQFLSAMANVPYSFLQGLGRADLTAKFQAAELVFYVPLLWGMTRTAGIAGAAAAWAIRAAADMILHFEAARRIGKLGLAEFKTHGCAEAFFVTGGFAAALVAGRHLPATWIWSVLALLAFLYAAWFLVFDPDERSRLNPLIRRFGLGLNPAKIPNVFADRKWKTDYPPGP